MSALPQVSREIETAEDAIVALRMALGMAIQVIASPQSYDEATRDHVRSEAVTTNLLTSKFDPRSGVEQIRKEVDGALVREILVALCERDGLSLDSHVEPGSPAPNYTLALRLGIAQVFGIPNDPSMIANPWLVPAEHRPKCPLNDQPCTSWTCLVDVCVSGDDVSRAPDRSLNAPLGPESG